MKIESDSLVNKNTKHCGLAFYKGNLQQYATTILSKKRGDGSVCRICDIHPIIVDDMKTKGVLLLSKDIIITQRQIFKYRNHPKTAKGANVPLVDYALVEETLRAPEHIYEDTVQNRLVYVCTHPYRNDRLVKVVIEPNHKSHGVIVNMAKSWGIVNPENMKETQYRMIK